MGMPSRLCTEIRDGEWKLIAVLERLDKSNSPATADNIQFLVDRKVPLLSRLWQQAADALVAMGILSAGAEYTFTEPGRVYRDVARRQALLVRFFYDEFYYAAERSAAHSEFCRQVYGLDLCQHGTADMQQLGHLTALLRNHGASRIVDLGCGNGMISEYLGDVLGASVVGVDFSPPTIARANARVSEKGGRVRFVVGDISDICSGSGPSDTVQSDGEGLGTGRFDAAVAIDSLYFVPDLRRAIGSIRRLIEPSGRLYAFWHFGLRPDGSRESPENSPLAKALGESGLTYIVVDLTAQNQAHWMLKKQVLLRLKDRFMSEGNMFLYNNRMDECEGTLHEWSRYLYVAHA